MDPVNRLRKSLLLPYIACITLPLAALIGPLILLIVPTIGSSRLFIWIYALAYAPGFYEVCITYFWVGAAQAPSVRRVKTVMNIGWAIIGAFAGVLFLAFIVRRAFAVDLPFLDAFTWVNGVAFSISASLLGGGALVALDRWSFVGSEELEIRYWRPFSRGAAAWGLCVVGFFSGILLSIPYPIAGLILFVSSSSILLVLAAAVPSARRDRDKSNQIPPRKVELRKYGHEERLSIGRQICSLVLQKYGRKVFAVCIWGGTAKTPDHAYSSLELLVVVRDGVRLPSESYVFNGLSVEVDYWQEISILNRVRQFDEDWPWYTGIYRNRIVLFERKAWLRRLDEAIEQSDKADSTDAIRKVALSLVDDLGGLRDYQLESDASGVKRYCEHIAWDTVRLVFLINRTYIERKWNEVFECPIKPSEFRGQVEVALGYVPFSEAERIRAAERLAEDGLELVRTRGISIETSQLLV